MYASIYKPYSARNIRHSHRSQVPGLRADLYRDGELVASVSIPDDEAAVEHQFVSVAAKYAFDNDMAALDPHFFGEKLADTETLQAWFITRLLKDTHLENQVRELCQTRTVFRLRGDLPNHWRMLEEVYSLAAAAEIRHDFGQQLELIANEVLAAGDAQPARFGPLH